MQEAVEKPDFKTPLSNSSHDVVKLAGDEDDELGCEKIGLQDGGEECDDDDDVAEGNIPPVQNMTGLIVPLLVDGEGIKRGYSTESGFHYRHPIDHGWAWVVALGGFIANIFFAGIVRSTGMLFVEYCELYNTNKTEASWIISALYISFYFSSPLSSLFGARFSGRATAFMAGIFSTVGLMISSFSPSIQVVYFSHGVLLGLTLSFLCAPILATVGVYFRRHSSLAIGITMMGASVGSFAVPPLVQVIMNEYGFRNMLMIMSAIFSHIFVLGALMRPISIYDKPRGTTCCLLSSPPPANTYSKASKHTNGNNNNNKCEKITAEIEISIDSDQAIADDNLEFKSKSKSKPKPTAAEVFNRVCPLWNLELLGERKLYIFIVSFALAHLGLILSFFVIPPHAQDIGLTDKERTLILFIMGFPDLVCRVMIGYIADRPEVNVVFLFSGIVLAQAVAWFVVTLTGNFIGMTVFGLLVSGLGGSIWTLIPIIYKATLGTRNMGTSMGFTLLFAGIVFLAIPPILGYIRDTTGSWIWSYRFVSSILALASILVLLEPLIDWIQKRRQHQRISKISTEEAKA